MWGLYQNKETFFVFFPRLQVNFFLSPMDLNGDLPLPLTVHAKLHAIMAYLPTRTIRVSKTTKITKWCQGMVQVPWAGRCLGGFSCRSIFHFNGMGFWYSQHLASPVGIFVGPGVSPGLVHWIDWCLSFGKTSVLWANP